MLMLDSVGPVPCFVSTINLTSLMSAASAAFLAALLSDAFYF